MIFRIFLFVPINIETSKPSLVSGFSLYVDVHFKLFKIIQKVLRDTENSDGFSSLVNKYFRKHHLLPSKKHSVYSLRHSFQDRLTHADVKDRMQAELMGHRFNRPLYGDGPTLQQKYDCLKVYFLIVCIGYLCM